ncbi:hypothetical protein C7974DRAFT_470184 [Boeremia exigua]|uniref:uncharacterized protein n=1 Tax=Boeremia exigua TaxID=749465 RepID=UPI001E8D71AF|nr:uncharacterized protein C7974DRAFT_470184 [Boeremia exigua]KAH6639725.1 hypothetical protein C7974DRAFT_470184 [Boeremia exigua]
MAEPPDRPRSRALKLTDGFAAPTPTDGASSARTPASTEVGTGSARQALLQSVTSENAELKAEIAALRQQNADLAETLLKQEQKINRLEDPPPTVITWLDATIRDKFSNLNELTADVEKFRGRVDASSIELQAERDAFNKDRQAFDDLVKIASNVALSNGIDIKPAAERPNASASEALEAEVSRMVALCLKDHAVIQEAAEVMKARDLAQCKLDAEHNHAKVMTSLESREDNIQRREAHHEQWLDVLKNFKYVSEEHRRRELAKIGAAAPPDERRYALSDPEIKSLLVERELAGYLEVGRMLDLRRAYRENLEGVDKTQTEYLEDFGHPNNPHQVGIKVGEILGFRCLCSAVGKPEWDHSLDTHQWKWQELWTQFPETVPDSFFAGVEKGMDRAKKRLDILKVRHTDVKGAAIRFLKDRCP